MDCVAQGCVWGIAGLPALCFPNRDRKGQRNLINDRTDNPAMQQGWLQTQLLTVTGFSVPASYAHHWPGSFEWHEVIGH